MSNGVKRWVPDKRNRQRRATTIRLDPVASTSTRSTNATAPCLVDVGSNGEPDGSLDVDRLPTRVNAWQLK